MLEVDNIHVSYDGVPALYGVSFRVEEGEIVSIVGSNGAGKSTVLRTISSLLRPTQGSIRMNGEDLTALRPHDVVLRGIAHVPEGRRLFNRQTIKDNLTLGAFTRRSQADREEVLEQVYEVFPILKKRLGQLAGTLSGGEQQMLAIARALMMKPKLLMLDEPSLGIAPKLVDEIFETLKEINEKQGITILLVEQHVHEALELADRAYVLQTGRVVMEGTGQELLQSDAIQKAYLGI
ncbi:MAG: ABC transporter ATP-binding protein [Bacillota bacterium]|nr:ABC transporter ATP-binding protein [Candidatus Fermentithermobacillaceae bacterium]